MTPPTRSQTHSNPGAIHVRAAYVLAFLSGIAALVYQVVWVKILSLSFGSTSVAAAAVISSIMAGLGLGAWLYRHLENRGLYSFSVYGTIELGIALTSAAVTPLLYRMPSVYSSLTGETVSSAQSLLVGFLSAFLLIVIPSALMGATFPALCRTIVRSAQGLRASLGPVYGLNTIGSAVGAVIAGFVLVETFGNLRSVWIASSINLTVGIFSFLLSRRAQFREPGRPYTDKIDSRPIEHSLPMWVIVATLAVSGFATMTYEILWFRAAKYLVGNSTYALSVVLAVFLFGLGIGGLLHRPIMRSRFPVHALAVCQFGIAVFALSAMFAQSWVLSSDWIWTQTSIFAFEAGTQPWSKLLMDGAMICAAILLPPTIFMGLSFPLASSLFVGRITLLGRHLGSAYLIANIGSIIGVITGAIVVLPRLGTIGGTQMVAGFNLLMGLIIAGFLWAKSRSIRKLVMVAVPICCLLAFMLPAKMAFRGELERQSRSHLLYWQEGDVSTVKVLKHPEAEMMGMTIDGYVIGVNTEYGQLIAQKQLFLAHLPMALAPESRTTLNIGLGSATTLAALGSYSSLDSLHCVEISREVIEGARFFDESKILDDPRTKVFVDDVVHYLRRSATTYDIIISDAKQNPQFPGNSIVLSREFLELCRAHLSEDGVMVQWSTLSLHPEVFHIILRTFLDTFENVSVYSFPPACMILVGRRTPLTITPEMVQPGFASTEVADHLRPYFVSSRSQLLAGWVTGDDGLRQTVPAGAINTWDRPILEFAPQKLFKPDDMMKYYWQNMAALIKAGESSVLPRPFVEIPDLTRSYSAARIVRYGILRMIETGDVASLSVYCEQALEADPGNSIAIGLLQSVSRGFDALFFRPGRI